MASSRAKVIRELSRSARTSSPRPEEFHTGLSDFNPDEAIHSTMQFGNTASQQIALTYDQYPEHHSEHGSEGSADMSIEIGRGMKRTAFEDYEDGSSNAVFTFGNDSQYELTGTPPIRSAGLARKSSAMQGKVAPVRRTSESARANEGAKRATSQSWVKHRSLSDALGKSHGARGDARVDVNHTAQHTGTVNARNTRFIRSRHVSGNAPAGQKAFSGDDPTKADPAMPSGTFTANSFLLPDMTNIDELVQGPRTDATPQFNRNIAKKLHSRFTTSHAPDRLPVESVPIPEEEKQIYASLQILQDKVAQLELERADSLKRVEEYEVEVIDLRSQLDREQQLRRPDSALGSEDESDKEKWRMERTKFQASIKTLQQRLERSERKVSVSDIAARRVTKERDELVARIGVTYYNMEEVKAENEQLREDRAKVLRQNEDLMDEVSALKNQLRKTKASAVQAKSTQAASETCQVNEDMNMSKPTKARRAQQSHASGQRIAHSAIRHDERKDFAMGDLDQEARDEITRTVQHQLDRMRDDARQNVRDRTRKQRESSLTRSRSKSQSRLARPVPQNIFDMRDAHVSDNESIAESEFTRTKEYTTTPKQTGFTHTASEDLTYLTKTEPAQYRSLRQALEEQRRAGHMRRHSSAPVTAKKDATVTQHATKSFMRKSSLKDITTGLTINNHDEQPFLDHKDGTTLKNTKTVRVQSPPIDDEQIHLDEDGVSTINDTNRLRRPSASVHDEGETSAFIIPDITLRHPIIVPSNATDTSAVQHKAQTCTICAAANNQHIYTPLPIPVSTRGDLPEDATLRPVQAPHLALATILQQLSDEVVHIKLTLARYEREYHTHDPALGASKRKALNENIRQLRAECEKRSGQIYVLYDVVEGQKDALNEIAARSEGNSGHVPVGGGQAAADMTAQEIEETLTSVGIGPAELAGRIARSAPQLGLDGLLGGYDDEDTLEMPVFASLSDEE